MTPPLSPSLLPSPRVSIQNASMCRFKTSLCVRRRFESTRGGFQRATPHTPHTKHTQTHQTHHTTTITTQHQHQHQHQRQRQRQRQHNSNNNTNTNTARRQTQRDRDGERETEMKRDGDESVKCNSILWHTLSQRECVGRMVK